LPDDPATRLITVETLPYYLAGVPGNVHLVFRDRPMRVLALEPYYGGSHRAFLDGWAKCSVHHWTFLTLPATKWKWRMRHAAVTFAAELDRRLRRGEAWDLVWCSDMLNLAEFRGLVDEPLRVLPAVAYFHENQLTYPVREEHERDYHFAMTNLTTALTAAAVWFNSAYHRDCFLDALDVFLRRMPDYQPLAVVDQLRRKARVFPPGIENFPARGARRPGPLRIVWAARWEHDKNPDDFFRALHILSDRGVTFRVSVIGQQFAEVPGAFSRAKEQFAEAIEHWGYLARREEYVGVLSTADVFVSTATHEFFGISAVEAIAAGAWPLLPRRLSYVEILAAGTAAARGEYFYNGSPEELADRLAHLAACIARDGRLPGNAGQLAGVVTRFFWDNCVPGMDAALAAMLPRN
jgi:glycosyltransferase involved in cell wall biosynthesis